MCVCVCVCLSVGSETMKIKNENLCPIRDNNSVERSFVTPKAALVLKSSTK